MLIEGFVLGAHFGQFFSEHLFGVGVEDRLGGGSRKEHLALVLQHAHLISDKLRKV